MLVYDNREKASGIPDLISIADDIEIVDQQLPVGDFLLSNDLIIERKTADDLVASLKDGRLFEQVFRMSEYRKKIFILEGTSPRLSKTAWRGTVASLTRSGFSVLLSKDKVDTADWIITLYRQENKKSKGAPSPVSKKKIRSNRDALKYMVSMIPGVSLVTAERLLIHFGTLADLVAASEKDLASVEGIGKKRASAIHSILNQKIGMLQEIDLDI